MKLNIKSLLKDRNVLRVVVFLSALNLIGYLMMRDFDAVFFFVLIGFLTTYFSKNMIIVLLTAMITANFFAMGRKMRRGIVEGMKNGKDTKGDTEMDTEEDTEETEDTEEEEKSSPEVHETFSNTKKTNKKPKKDKLDHKATVDAAYEHLDNLLGSETIGKMSEHTKALADRQAKLGKQIENLQPIINKSMQTLDKIGGVDGINKMIGSLSGMVGKIPGMK